MASKLVRDPLYNYIPVGQDWLVRLIDTPEVQRLRRIHQLGVSSFTYPGADHSRLSHTLGVLHLMQLAVARLREVLDDGTVVGLFEPRLYAAAVLHDVGHAPFSHLLEKPLGIDHEAWSKRIVLDPETSTNKVLRRVDGALPEAVAALIDPKSLTMPAWPKSLLSSQLDVDRIDYLRRDSLFTGAGYGHFDWARLIATMEIHESDAGTDLVWPEKSAMAIEEYIFARYYMYQNVYLHKTTRGFECLLQELWRRAKAIHDEDAGKSDLDPVIKRILSPNASAFDFIQLEEFVVLAQLQRWAGGDSNLADLARRFLVRDGLAMVCPPTVPSDPTVASLQWDAFRAELQREVLRAGGPDAICLEDKLLAKYMTPYFPEKEGDEQSVRNAIRLRRADGSIAEVSTVLKRLSHVTSRTPEHRRYYVSKEPTIRVAATRMAANWTWPLLTPAKEDVGRLGLAPPGDAH